MRPRGDDAVDVLIVGGGVVGLACAAVLSRAGHAVALVERHAREGQETSSRNSGVIHAGLYYAAGSLKARTCVEGRARLYARCEREGIAHRRTGKLLVATTDAEEEELGRIERLARAAGVHSLEPLTGAELRRREPRLRGVAALSSPETGVVDVHGVLQSYKREAQRHGAELVVRTTVVALARQGGTWRATLEAVGGAREDVRAEVVVNAAGLEADRVAALAGIDVDAAGWRIHPCKGDYFALAPGAPRPNAALVYPVPKGGGLGIHLTTDLGGRCTAGPDAYDVDRIDYAVDPAKARAFAEDVARYFPDLRPEHLTADYAGIRPKLRPPPGAFSDFVVEESAARGASRMVNLVGIESPGLTASEAIAEEVRRLVGEPA